MEGMFTVSRVFTFCYAHRLRQHPGKCANLHGHNGTVKIELQCGHLNQQGMVADFGDIKQMIGTWIDENLDHRTILEHSDPLADVLDKLGEPILRLPDEPTAENLAKLIFKYAKSLNLPVHAVSVSETEKCTAMYCNNN